MSHVPGSLLESERPKLIIRSWWFGVMACVDTSPGSVAAWLLLGILCICHLLRVSGAASLPASASV